MFDKAIQFLKDHKEIALATSEGNLPKLRIFQIMKQEGHVLYFATSARKAVYRELRQNPNIEIQAYADNISVRCSGMVNFNVEDDVKQWIYEHNDVLSRLYPSYDQMEPTPWNRHNCGTRRSRCPAMCRDSSGHQ